MATAKAIARAAEAAAVATKRAADAMAEANVATSDGPQGRSATSKEATKPLGAKRGRKTPINEPTKAHNYPMVQTNKRPTNPSWTSSVAPLW